MKHLLENGNGSYIADPWALLSIVVVSAVVMVAVFIMIFKSESPHLSRWGPIISFVVFIGCLLLLSNIYIHYKGV